MYISLYITYKHAHTTSHISLFCSHSFFPVLPLSCCLGVLYLNVSDDHSVNATTPLFRTLAPLLSTSSVHLTTHCISYEFYVLYSILLYNVAVLCYIAFHCLEEKQSCLSLFFSLLFSLFSVCLSLPLSLCLSLQSLCSRLASLCLQFFVLFFVFLHHFISLESPRHASDL